MSDLYEIIEEPALRDPALVLAMSGWVDAGASGTEAAQFLAETGTEIARFNGDAIFDYRANRPTVRFRAGKMTDIDWPALTLYHRALEERDLLVLVGNEPDFQWKAVAQAIADLMERLGANLIITIGAVPAAVPHTYPPPVMMTASSDELVGSDDVALGDDLDVPGAAVNVAAAAAVDRGMGTIGYWAQIPHYVSERYHAGALALVRRVALRLGLDLRYGLGLGLGLYDWRWRRRFRLLEDEPGETLRYFLHGQRVTLGDRQEADDHTQNQYAGQRPPYCAVKPQLLIGAGRPGQLVDPIDWDRLIHITRCLTTGGVERCKPEIRGRL